MIYACAAQGWAQKFIKMFIGLFFWALPFFWFLWCFLVCWGSPWWFSGWKAESLVTLLCVSCNCVQCQIAVGQRKEKSTRDFPESCGIIAPPVGALRLLGDWYMRKWRKEQNKWGIFSPSLGKLRVSFPASWAKSKLMLLELFFCVCSGFIWTLKRSASTVNFKFCSFPVHLLPFTFQMPFVHVLIAAFSGRDILSSLLGPETMILFFILSENIKDQQ